MPLYEYICEECGHAFEKLLSFSKADLPQACPTCGAAKGQRKLSSFAVSGGASSSPSALSTRPARSPFS